MILAAVLALFMVATASDAQTPAGWDAAYQRAAQLILDHKTSDAIAIYQRIVRQAPDFQPARYELADALRLRALENILRNGSAAARRQDFEQAETHFRFVRDHGGEYRPLAVMKLVSLYGEA